MAQSVIFAQGMFVKKSNISLDIGTGYVNNKINSPTSISYSYNSYVINAGINIFRIFDIGGTYYKPVDSPAGRQLSDASSFFLNAYLYKKNIGLVLNSAISNTPNGGDILLGLTFYGNNIQTYTKLFFDGFFPVVSAGFVLAGVNENFVFGFSVPLQKIINKHYSIVLTPGFNYSKEDIQLLIGLDFIFQ
jgi:hypothetical protein